MAVFLIMVLDGFGFDSFARSDLLAWGGLTGSLIKNGEWWRLLTNVLIHQGFSFVVISLGGMLIVGPRLELFLGKTTFFLVYVCAGVCAGLASIWWHDASVTIGSFGAIFGLIGVATSLWFAKRLPSYFDRQCLTLLGLFVCITLLIV